MKRVAVTAMVLYLASCGRSGLDTESEPAGDRGTIPGGAGSDGDWAAASITVFPAAAEIALVANDGTKLRIGLVGDVATPGVHRVRIDNPDPSDPIGSTAWMKLPEGNFPSVFAARLGTLELKVTETSAGRAADLSIISLDMQTWDGSFRSVGPVEIERIPVDLPPGGMPTDDVVFETWTDPLRACLRGDGDDAVLAVASSGPSGLVIEFATAALSPGVATIQLPAGESLVPEASAMDDLYALRSVRVSLSSGTIAQGQRLDLRLDEVRFELLPVRPDVELSGLVWQADYGAVGPSLTIRTAALTLPELPECP